MSQSTDYLWTRGRAPLPDGVRGQGKQAQVRAISLYVALLLLEFLSSTLAEISRTVPKLRFIYGRAVGWWPRARKRTGQGGQCAGRPLI